MLQWGDRHALEGGERPMILQHRGCGGELDDRRRCLTCGADVTVTEADRHPDPGPPPGTAHRGRRAGGGAAEVEHARTGLNRPGAAPPASLPCMSMSDDTAWLDATAQAELVRTEEVSPSELVDCGHRPH